MQVKFSSSHVLCWTKAISDKTWEIKGVLGEVEEAKINNDFLANFLSAFLSRTIFSLLEFDESLILDVSTLLGFNNYLVFELPFKWCFESLSTTTIGGEGRGARRDVETCPFLWYFEILASGGGARGMEEEEDCTFILDLLDGG